MDIAIVGATGNVGRKTLEVLEKKKLPINNVYLVASSKSAGKKIRFKGKDHEVFDLESFDFSKVKITFLEKFEERRGRVNCSLKDENSWRWLGFQFSIENS